SAITTGRATCRVTRQSYRLRGARRWTVGDATGGGGGGGGTAGGLAEPRITGGWAGRRGAAGSGCGGACGGGPWGGRTTGGRAGEIGTGVANRWRGDRPRGASRSQSRSSG